MSKFFVRHPFTKQLLKLSAAIFVGYNTLAIAMIGPFFVFLVFVMAIAMGSNPGTTDTTGRQSVYGTGGQQFLSLKISGPITGEASESAFGLDSETYGYEIKDKLHAAADEDSIKGVILEINSPGGTIYGAHAIADGVKYYKQQTKKPVYAYIQGMGASGAYWAAASADKIYADYGSDIGSIGVIMGPFKYYDKPVSEDGGLFAGGVVTQNGIENLTITAGKSKDLGNPYRRLTPDEIKMLQTQVNNDYDVFVKYVSERRGIPEATIRNQIGAMAYDNKTALDYKLIDATGSREDAYEAMAAAGKAKDDFEIMRDQTKSGFWHSLLSAFSQKPAKEAKSAGPCRYAQAHLAYSGDVTALCGQ